MSGLSPVSIGYYCQEMSQLRQKPDEDVLVRFWSLDHHRAEQVVWPVSSWVKLVFAAEGTLMVQTRSHLHLLPPNRAILIPAGEPHPSRTLGRARVRTLYFPDSSFLSASYGVLEVRPLFRELISEACRVGPLRSTRPREWALSSLLAAEIELAPRMPTSIQMPRSGWLAAWAEAFLDDPATPEPAGFSRRTIERRMTSETGLSLGLWRQQARALRGLQALSSGSTVLEAAMAAGFDTCSGFIQSFRRQFGVTPGRFLSGTELPPAS